MGVPCGDRHPAVRYLGSGPHRRAAVSLWAKVRGVPVVGTATILTILALVLPVSVAAATPSPAGATLAAACLLALAVPVAVGWGCARGDALLEAVSTQPVRVLDLILAVAAVGLTAGMALLLELRRGRARRRHCRPCRTRLPRPAAPRHAARLAERDPGPGGLPPGGGGRWRWRRHRPPGARGPGSPRRSRMRRRGS